MQQRQPTEPHRGGRLCGPRDVAVDGAGNVYIADTNNNRVLEYDTPFTKGTAASRVFGQGGSFTSAEKNLGGISANSMFIPDGVAVDTSGALYVAEQLNSRVLVFKTPMHSTTADLVLGQGSSFTTGACNQGGAASAATLCKPQGLALDASSNLYVADVVNNRVLEYDQPISTGRSSLRWVFGQGGSFTTTGCDLGGVSAQFLCAPRQVALDAFRRPVCCGHLQPSRAGVQRPAFERHDSRSTLSARWASSTATTSSAQRRFSGPARPASPSIARTTSTSPTRATNTSRST